MSVDDAALRQTGLLGMPGGGGGGGGTAGAARRAHIVDTSPIFLFEAPPVEENPREISGSPDQAGAAGDGRRFGWRLDPSPAGSIMYLDAPQRNEWG